MSRSNIVKMLSEDQKWDLYKMYLKNQHKTKKAFAKEVGISTRTLGRIIKEFEVTNIFVGEKAKVYDYSVTKNQITIFCNEQSRSVVKGYPKFSNIKSKLMETNFSDESLKEAYDLLYLPTFVDKFSEGNITVDHENGKVWYGTFEIKNSLTDHMITQLTEGNDVTGFIRFADMLLSNPKEDIVEELYGFMEYNGISIDEDGYIIAYKGVRQDYKDSYTGTIDNSIGTKPRMPAKEVEHDPSKGCGAGLHAGSFEYACNWAGKTGHVVKLKINPIDVCSVPWDCGSQKMRTCGYEVIEEIKGEL